MICGDFKESVCKTISLDDVGEGSFLKLIRLACGEDGLTAENVEDLLDIGALADRLQMEAIRDHAEDVLSEALTECNCLEIFQRSEVNGLERMRRECYEKLRDEFPAISQQEGFGRLSEEIMTDLLEEDALGNGQEEDIFEALVRWMKSRGKGHRGDGLLRKVRYGVIGDKYLASDMLSALPGNDTLQMLVEEAMTKKGWRASVKAEWDCVERLCEKWMVARKMKASVIGVNVLEAPRGVAIDSQGLIVVTDLELHQIIFFNRDGSVARRIGSKGEAAGQLHNPRGVAVDRQGRIVVADSNNHRVQMLNADGSTACCFGSKGTAVGQFDCPFGVAIDREGHILVADHWNNRIQIFNADGSIVRHFGSGGTAIGQLRSPTGVAVDRKGRIVVADSDNNRVQVFNGDGTVALCFGSTGDKPGQLNSTWGVAVDREGRFVVAEMYNRRVQVFNSDGSVVRVIDAAESSLGVLGSTYGVALDGAGRIVVAEPGRLRIF